MTTSIIRIITLAACLALQGCGTLLLSQMMADNSARGDVDQRTLAGIEALIDQQPAKHQLLLSFDQTSSSLKRADISRLSEWLRLPVKDVVIHVGPVRHENVIQAVAISRARGERVLTILNTFKIPARIRYNPELKVNTLEISGWL